MIHVCYGLYDRDGHYSKFVGTSIASVFENTAQSITVHILHDNTLTVGNRDKFIYLAGRYGQTIKFYNLDELAADWIEKIKIGMPEWTRKRLSIGSAYRLFIPLLVSSDRIIYLDADILVNRDIADLWNIRLSDRPLAAMPEFACGVKFSADKYLITSETVEGEDYMNSGVLLLDIGKLRENEELINEGIEFVGAHPECRYLDQDILNYCFSKNYLRLTPDFNCFVDVERNLHAPCVVKPHIYHFLSHSLNADLNDCFNRLYFEYFSKTPWFEVDMFDGILKEFNANRKACIRSMLRIINLLGRRRRAFFSTEENFEALSKFFSLTEDETFYNASVQNSVKRLITEMRADNGRRVFFILHQNYNRIRRQLIENGLVENRDFIDVTIFSTDNIDTYSLVRAV